MRTKGIKVISAFLLFALILSSPYLIVAQTKIMGELTISGNASKSDNFIIINGENVSDGRKIFSPASIVTPSKTTAELSIPTNGKITIGEGSTLNLFFENANITGDFWSGKLTFELLPNTKFNILTADGNVSNTAVNKQTIAAIDFVDGKLRLQTITGEISLNEVKVPAGQTFLARPRTATVRIENPTTPGSSRKKRVFLISLGVAGAFAVGLLIGRAADNDR